MREVIVINAADFDWCLSVGSVRFEIREVNPANKKPLFDFQEIDGLSERRAWLSSMQTCFSNSIMLLTRQDPVKCQRLQDVKEQGSDILIYLISICRRRVWGNKDYHDSRWIFSAAYHKKRFSLLAHFNFRNPTVRRYLVTLDYEISTVIEWNFIKVLNSQNLASNSYFELSHQVSKFTSPPISVFWDKQHTICTRLIIPIKI